MTMETIKMQLTVHTLHATPHLAVPFPSQMSETSPFQVQSSQTRHWFLWHRLYFRYNGGPKNSCSFLFIQNVILLSVITKSPYTSVPPLHTDSQHTWNTLLYLHFILTANTHETFKIFFNVNDSPCFPFVNKALALWTVTNDSNFKFISGSQQSLSHLDYRGKEVVQMNEESGPPSGNSVVYKISSLKAKI